MSQPKKDSPASSRREFNKGLAALAAASLSPDRIKTQAQEPPPAKPNPRAGTAEALTEIVRLRYGAYLSDDQVKEIRRSLERSLGSAARLRQFKLQNGDEPAFTFSADLP
jgi:hypothetical protein